ncbi:MAG: metallophosphoesterase [Clostridia bacterium]|nr:metallophosphoesterase [Clostridia bacterium]
MKRKLVIVISALLIVSLTFFTFTACKKKVSKYVSFTVPLTDNGTLRVLQITDTHFINSSVEDKNPAANYTYRDMWAKTAIAEVVSAADPDLIIVTGDSIFTLPLVKTITKTEDNYAAFQEFARYMDSFKIPWAFLFGNHDEEGSLNRTYRGDSVKVKKKLGEFLTSSEIKYCMYVNGPDDITGVGNYIINVVDKEGSTVMPMVLFDSGSYLKGVDENGEYEAQRNYEWVHDDQLDWYEAAINDISRIEKRKVESIVFQHIPFPEYGTVIDSYIQALTDLGENWRDTINENWVFGTERTLNTSIGPLTYYGGVYNDGSVASSFVGEYRNVYYDGGHEFERLLKVGSTKYVFCGHDHRNTFSFDYKGIRLSYGMSIDYSANGLISIVDNQTIYDETVQRGGTMIVLKENGSVSIEQIPFTRNLYRETVAALDLQNNG